MVDQYPSPLEEVRTVLFGSERDEIELLRQRVEELSKTVADLESLIVETSDRAATVSEVLIDAVEDPAIETARLGLALQGEVEHAVHISARADSVVLAEALYPVMGPALRKMIADLFTFGDGASGVTFGVSQVLLIDRATGLLLASSSSEEDRGDADVVSGMLDAIRLFVQEAFDASEHDGLRDLRVGETSVLVEWGPHAVLASVTQGVPTDEYRHRCAKTLEDLHANYREAFVDFQGRIEPFETAEPILDELRRSEDRPRSPIANVTAKWPAVVAVAVLILLIVLLILLVT